MCVGEWVYVLMGGGWGNAFVYVYMYACACMRMRRDGVNEGGSPLQVNHDTNM